MFIQGEDAENLRKANITPTFKKGKEEDLIRLVSLHLGPREVIEQIILEPIYKHMKDKKVLASSHHKFIKGK